ncbi:NAD+ synthase [Sphingomonadales bacterium 56]|uniref:NAD+ synthase n=1 Tax=unclassified Sphingobium TaxID=2611147 RepID=UPI00191AD2CC|nr:MULTISPECIES: NAD+ synthase [unclassified Sphingobium]MBY2929594.1 NAD+ synthase [Sphingomonadales bacterium 56]MBY2958564.1 NAD+ synthase [Sphingomonadales bacterium 58]CAD7337332.1 Glutamine-dependent NAD(+) synthetase [Sphingobium sp. S8]CAD7339689.1 Glutamine-dependent NAD(+) synthetase [Sphingobium sp. S6]
MTDKLVIALAQMTQSVGDLKANADAMLEWRARAAGADLIVFPELQLIGYPPEDLVLKPALVDRANHELDRLAQATADGGPAMLVGTVVASQGVLFNVVALLEDGAVTAIRQKRELPNYGTFDEKRLFAPGPLPAPIDFRGVKIGVPICEDIWFPFVTAHLRAEGAEILISPNGSPFEVDKDDRRINAVAGTRVRETSLPLVYLNRVGGQDELVFDGASFVMGADRSIAHQLPDWEEALVLTHWEKWEGQWVCIPGDRHELDSRPADIYNAMVLGLRDYVNRNGFPGVVLGLSGGIDSALSAAVAVDALGPDRVWSVMLPSRFTSQDSLDDAVECARLLGIRYDTIPIQPAVAAFDSMLADSFEGRQRDLTEENLQSRIRGVTLMGLSNKFGHMLLTTGNKSEMSVGYATIYGDMAGGYSVLKDAYKTTVFDLSRWRNENVSSLGLGPSGPVMPERVITKPPSAELREDQKDEDSLPPYEVLDPILYGLVEEELSVEQLVARGFDKDVVARIERLLYVAEYKRRQSPPGVKLGIRNFGRDRRYPITNAFRTL